MVKGSMWYMVGKRWVRYRGEEENGDECRASVRNVEMVYERRRVKGCG